MTSARLSALLAGLPVATEEMELSAPLPAPAPEDLPAVAGMAGKRRIEYLAGRQCARAALARLGVGGHVLRAGPDRGPIWPAGFVGSITHTGTASDGFCGVAVARARDIAALGIDAELDRPLPDELLPVALTARERDILLRGPAASRGRLATVYFSAKESIYKALAPLLGVFIEFDQADLDLEIDLAIEPGTPGAGRFTAQVRAPATAAVPVLAGRVLVTQGLVLTAAVAAA